MRRPYAVYLMVLSVLALLMNRIASDRFGQEVLKTIKGQTVSSQG